jgi:HAD superfamily hydrolase (TIGR01509 family)
MNYSGYFKGRYATLSRMSIDAVIFDMDGLMMDTEPCYRAAWQRAARGFGYEISDEAWFDFIGLTRAGGEDLLLRLFGAGFPLAAFRDASVRCENDVFVEFPPSTKPGLEGLLAFLDLSRIRRAVATSTDRTRTTAQLTQNGLLNRFDALATGDEVATGKPSPDVFLLAAERLAVDPVNCLALEDSEAGVLAAHRAGMRVFIVPDLKAPSKAIEALAQGKFNSLTEVEAKLRGMLRLRR